MIDKALFELYRIQALKTDKERMKGKRQPYTDRPFTIRWQTKGLRQKVIG